MAKNNDDTTDTFGKVGDYDTVVNISGAPSANTMPVPRPRTVTTPPLGQHMSHRRPIEVDALSGEAFGAATAARAREVWADAVGQLGDPGQRVYLRNLLGVQPGRDREM